MYSEEELKTRREEWLKDASTDPIKKERIEIIQALLKDIQYKSAETKERVIKGFASSGLDMQFILNYAEQARKVQGKYGHFS